MTSHELAKKLLEMPDLPVTYLDWCAGSKQWAEVEDVDSRDGTSQDEEGDKFGQPHIHLS